jgi:hypothetical protein
MRTTTLPLLAVLLCCACESAPPANDTAASATATGSASAATKGLGKLTATVNGEPMGLKTALAYSEGGRGIELVFSTAEPKCADFAGNGRMLADGERSFTLSVGPVLAKDGTESWGVTTIYFDSNTRQSSELGRATLSTSDPSKTVAGDLDFTFDVKASEFLKRPAQSLVVKGAFDAKGCGIIEKEGRPPKRAQKELTLSVSGKAFDVVAAIVKPTTFPKPGHELLLSTAPASCDASPSGEDLVVKANVSADGKVQFIYMAGAVIPSQMSASVTDKEPTIEAKPDGELDGEGEVTIALSGSYDVLGYALKVDGKVSALRCPK